MWPDGTVPSADGPSADGTMFADGMEHIQPNFCQFTSIPVLLGLTLSLSNCSRKADDQGISPAKSCESLSKNMPYPVITTKL